MKEKLRMIQVYFHAIMKIYNRYLISINFVFMILYKIALDFFYIFVVSKEYAYEGMILQASGVKYLVSWIFYIILAIMIPKNKINAKNAFLHLQLFITVTPMLTVYALADKSTRYMTMVFFVLIIQMIILRDREDADFSIAIGGLNKYLFPFLWIFLVCTYVLTVLYGGFSGIKAFDLKYLYVIRENASFPGWLSYMIGWMTGTIIPFLLVESISSRKYVATGLLIVMDIMAYMTLGNKTIYLTILVLVGLLIIVRLRLFHVGIYAGMVCLTSFLSVSYLLENNTGLRRITRYGIAFVGERFLFIPAVNKFVYYECFSQYPKVGFSDGLLGKAFGLTYPYKGSIGQTIFAYMNEGRLFESNSNTGYLGDSYAQAGFLGLLIIGVLVALFVKVLDGAGKNIASAIMIPLVGSLAILLNDSAFITIFMSSGWGILLLILLIYNARGKINAIKRGEVM